MLLLWTRHTRTILLKEMNSHAHDRWPDTCDKLPASAPPPDRTHAINAGVSRVSGTNLHSLRCAYLLLDSMSTKLQRRTEFEAPPLSASRVPRPRTAPCVISRTATVASPQFSANRDQAPVATTRARQPLSESCIVWTHVGTCRAQNGHVSILVQELDELGESCDCGTSTVFALFP